MCVCGGGGGGRLGLGGRISTGAADYRMISLPRPSQNIASLGPRPSSPRFYLAALEIKSG